MSTHKRHLSVPQKYCDKQQQFTIAKFKLKLLHFLLQKNGKCDSIFEVTDFVIYAQIAQLVEQRTENPRVAGSIPALGIISECSKHCLS